MSDVAGVLGMLLSRRAGVTEKCPAPMASTMFGCLSLLSSVISVSRSCSAISGWAQSERGTFRATLWPLKIALKMLLMPACVFVMQ